MDFSGCAIKLILNVGGENKTKSLPTFYKDWKQVLLDLNPHPDVDWVHDARRLTETPSECYDAVYCAHNLEHYYEWEVPRVLSGFRHIIKPTGFVHIVVPDLVSFVRQFLLHSDDLEHVVGHCEYGPVRVLDVLYGHQGHIEKTKESGHGHKTGFSQNTLKKALTPFFEAVYIQSRASQYELHALAFATEPTEEERRELGLI